MRWIIYIATALAAVVLTDARRNYAGGSRGHDNNDGLYCNYYATNDRGERTVESVLCQYGCCGTINDQKCCDQDDDDDDSEERESAGRSVTFVLAGVLGLSLLTVLLTCAFWCYKRSKARRCKTYHSDGSRNSRNTGRGGVPTAPPKYTLTPRPGHALLSTNYNVFMVTNTNPPPPAYTYLPDGVPAPPGQPTTGRAPQVPVGPAPRVPDLPPYTPQQAESADNLANMMRSPPPPYSPKTS